VISPVHEMLVWAGAGADMNWKMKGIYISAMKRCWRQGYKWVGTDVCAVLCGTCSMLLHIIPCLVSCISYLVY